MFHPLAKDFSHFWHDVKESGVVFASLEVDMITTSVVT